MSDFSGSDPVTPPSSGQGGTGKKTAGCLWLALLVIGVPAACAVLLSSNGSSDWEPTTVEARLICEDWVRDRLRAPGTARFNNGDETGSAGNYTITGTVDSENGFGALLRSSWECSIRWDDASEMWRGTVDVREQ